MNGKRKSVLYRLFLIVSAAVAILLISAYISFPYLAERLFLTQAPRWGINITEFEASRPGSGALHLRSLAVEHPKYRAAFEDVNLSYAPLSLLFGKLKEVRVSRAKITLNETLFAPSSEADEKKQDISLYSTLQRLPVSSLIGEHTELSIEHPSGSFRISGSLEFENALRGLSGEASFQADYYPAGTDAFNIHGKGRLSLNDKELRLELSEAQSDSKQLRFSAFAVEPLTLTLGGQADATFNLETGAFAATVPLTAPQLIGSFEDGKAHLVELKGELGWESAEETEFFLKVQAKRGTLEYLSNSYRVQNLAVTATQDGDDRNGTFFLEAAGGSIPIEGNFSDGFLPLQGTAVVQARLKQLDQNRAELAALLASLPVPLRLTGGSARAELVVSFDKAPRLSSQTSTEAELFIEADDLSGSYADIPFTGFDVSELRIDLPQLTVTRPALLTLERFTLGTEFTNARLALTRYEPERFLSFNKASVRVFGGELLLKSGELDLSAQPITLPIEVHGLKLEEALALYAEQGVSGEGKLDGSLPTQITSEGVIVENGSLYAQTPGVIRYKNPGTANDGSLALVMTALENFHYDSLKAAIDYQPNGALNTSLQLTGNNPEQKGDQKINLNLNVEQNILSLLKSLSFAERLEKELSGIE